MLNARFDLVYLALHHNKNGGPHAHSKCAVSLGLQRLFFASLSRCKTPSESSTMTVVITSTIAQVHLLLLRW